MQKLAVVNTMLGTLGERPISSITDPHRFLSACLAGLDEANRAIQGRGWWFNMDEVKITPSSVDDSLYLPNDCLAIRVTSALLVKRGNRVYNLDGGSYEFTSPVCITLIRNVPFEDLPDTAATYIAARAIYDFQVLYDGDGTKTQVLGAKLMAATVDINTEHTRNRRSNFILSNDKLQRLKQTTNGARRFIR